MSNKKNKKSKEMGKPETKKCPKCETINDLKKEKCMVCHEDVETKQQDNKEEQLPSKMEQQSGGTEQQSSEVGQQSSEVEQQSNETNQQVDGKKQQSKKEEQPEKDSSEEESEPSILKAVFVLGIAALVIFIIVMAIVVGRGLNNELNVEEVEVTEEVEETEELAEEPMEEEVEIPESVLSNDYVVILQYKGLELFGMERQEVEITDDNIELIIQSELAAQSTTNEVTDRPAEDGDTVTIDFAGSVDGEYFDGGTSEGFDLTLGAGMFIGPYGDYEGFEEQIIGHEIGDNFDITIQFPSDYFSPDLAGEVANFNITIHAITETITPELTDEWVQENSAESTTVEEYRQEIKEMLYETTKLNILFMQQHEVFEALMEQVVVVEIPEWAIEEEAEKLTTLFRNLAASEGMTLEEYLLTFIGLDEETFHQEVLSVAKETAPRTLAINLILENENIEPTPEEMANLMEALALLNGMESAEEAIETLGEEHVHETVILLKVTEFLIEHAISVY